MNQAPVKLSIIIPHHKGEALLYKCIQSLHNTSYSNYEIIVVDNNSKDQSILKSKKEFPGIKVLSLDQNLGYAGGCNKGALEAQGELLLFLNNDTIHENNWIEPLVDMMDNYKDIGSIQPKIKNINNNDIFDYAGGSGGFLDIFCFPFARGRIFSSIEVDINQYDNQVEVFWASGCAFITRKNIFNQITFDSTLFAYMEEIDYAWKLHLLGYKNYVEPKSVIYHDGGEFSSSNLFKSYYNHRNSLILFLTNHNLMFTAILLLPKILLELISLVRYLLLLNFSGIVAQLSSIIWILSHPHYIIRRIIKINRIKRKPLYSIIKKMYKPSIVIAYFIFLKKKFSDLSIS